MCHLDPALLFDIELGILIYTVQDDTGTIE